jgi:hypothetical protein
VTDIHGGQVLFEFSNAGPASSSITDVYFDDGTLLGTAELTNGDLRIGFHVQDFDGGGRESFVNDPVPEPSTALLIGMGLSVLASRRR